jgi:hypothetical protein
MDVVLKRVETNKDGIFGELYDNLGNLLAFTLEHNYDGKAVIPSGSFSCLRRVSPHFGYELFCLENVPGHDFVEIHPGNIQSDSHGCILIGEARQGNAIVNSRNAFRKFMELQKNVDTITLVVE